MSPTIDPHPHRFDVPCTITVTHTDESLEAHVDLASHVPSKVGDKILVHGAAIAVPWGETICIERMATVIRASALERAWVRFLSWLEFKELYEVSFSPGSLKP
ncbi:MAG: hypothetical protein AAF829_06225 [Pseudomonadota bacterium]